MPRRAALRRANLPSLQHEELVGPRAREAQWLEEERASVLGHLDQLKGRIKELEQQLQETSREVRGRGVLPGPPCLTALASQRPIPWARAARGRGGHPDAAVPVQAEMERALLQGEREAEAARLRQEQEAAQQLQEKLSSLDASIRKERDKVSPGAGLPGASGAVPIPMLAAGAAVPHAVASPWGHILLSPGSEGSWEHPLWVRVVRAGGVCLSVRPSAWDWFPQAC